MTLKNTADRRWEVLFTLITANVLTLFGLTPMFLMVGGTFHSYNGRCTQPFWIDPWYVFNCVRYFPLLQLPTYSFGVDPKLWMILFTLITGDILTLFGLIALI